MPPLDSTQGLESVRGNAAPTRGLEAAPRGRTGHGLGRLRAALAVRLARIARYFATPSRQVAATSAVLSLTLIGHFAITQSEAYQDATERAERDTRSVASLLAEHATRTFGGVEETLHAVGRLRADVARGIYRSQASIYVNLKTLRGGSTTLREIGWYDQYGARVASSEQPDPPHTNIAGADFFRALRDGDAGGLYVAAPVLTAEDGWRIFAALRLANLDGSFAGVAVASLDPADFVRIYRKVELTPGIWATLFRRDGIVLASSLSANAPLGRTLADRPLFRKHLQQAPHGSYHAERPTDGVPFIGSYASIRGSGTELVVHVGVPRREALTEFQRDFQADGLQTILFLLVLTVGGPLLVRSLRRRERLEQDLEAALTVANAQRVAAEQASKAKSCFLANMSHELRTPLNAIIGFSDMMGMKIKGPLGHPDYEVYVGDIRKSGAHLLNIINDVLDVARIEAGKAVIHEQEVQMAPLAEDVGKILGPLLQRARLTLALDIAPAAPAVRADPRALRQILLNLVSNAIKFTPEGGSIRVGFKRIPGAGAVLSVADTGIGIPAAELPKLMQPFAQVHDVYQRKHQGAGLGLTLVRSLAELHGGSVKIESTPGLGTTVSVALPESRVVAAQA